MTKDTYEDFDFAQRYAEVFPRDWMRLPFVSRDFILSFLLPLLYRLLSSS